MIERIYYRFKKRARPCGGGYLHCPAYSGWGQPGHSGFLETERNLRLLGYLNGHAAELGNERAVDDQTETEWVSCLLGAGYKAVENHSLSAVCKLLPGGNFADAPAALQKPEHRY